MGTGALSYPRDKVAELMYTTVCEFDKTGSNLKDVRFLCFDDDTIKVNEFSHNFNQYQYLKNHTKQNSSFILLVFFKMFRKSIKVLYTSIISISSYITYSFGLRLFNFKQYYIFI